MKKSTTMKKSILVISLFLMVSSTTLCFAENNPGEPMKKATVTGKVIDKVTGESLAGVLVTIKGSDLKVYSDLDGNFSFNSIEPGNYTLEVNYISYAANEVQNISCNAGKNLPVSIEIKPN
jgi:hypothetical protein